MFFSSTTRSATITACFVSGFSRIRVIPQNALVQGKQERVFRPIVAVSRRVCKIGYPVFGSKDLYFYSKSDIKEGLKSCQYGANIGRFLVAKESRRCRKSKVSARSEGFPSRNRCPLRRHCRSLPRRCKPSWCRITRAAKQRLLCVVSRSISPLFERCLGVSTSNLEKCTIGD